MPTAAKLVKEIRQTLAGSGATVPAESLAADYANLAREANQRLESCAAMIEKGSEYQALQLAETEPPLLDVLAALSFAEAPEWVDLCQNEKLPVPPKFDSQAVQALDALYAKGIGASHPLYKEYRAAVTSRDDVKALHIIRSIARLNPADANATAELARWEKKFYQIKRQDLRAALAGGDRDAILHELAELERLAEPAKLAELPEFVEAAELRRTVERQEAEELAARLVDLLPAERQVNAWRNVGELLSRIRTLQDEHGFRLLPAAAARCTEMQAYFDQERAEATATARFQGLVHAADAAATQVTTQLQARATLTLPQAEARYLEFVRRWKEVEGCGRPAPEDVVERVRAAASGLKNEIDRLQRARRRLVVSAFAAGALALLVSGWWAVRAFRAEEYGRQLADLQAAGQVEAAEKMLAHLQANDAGLLAIPALRAHVDQMQKWTRDERAQENAVDGQLAALEKTAAADFAGADPTSLENQVTSAAQAIEALPSGLKAAPAARLAALRSEFDASLAKSRTKLLADADAKLAALETLSGSKLNFEQPREAIAQAVEAVKPRLEALEARENSTLPALVLPADLQTRVTALRKRFDLFHGELEALAQANETLYQATSLDSYEQALSAFKSSRLNQDDDVTRARKMLAEIPAPDALLGNLLLPGDPRGWAAAKADPTGESFAPESVAQDELAKLVSLREDPYLNDIWELTLSDYTRKSGRHQAFSRGDVKVEGPRDPGDGSSTTTWSGAIYDPSLKMETPAFLDTTLSSTRTKYGTSGTGEITSIQPSTTSQLLTRLELNRMTSADGQKYDKPLLRIFDDLAADKDGSPIFKAYVMQQLAALMSLRPYDWGLEYCPTLKADLAALQRATDGVELRGEDWLLPRKQTQFAVPLGAFFQQIQSHRYL
jgi:hypothetical protein